MIMSEKVYREYPHHLDNPENIIIKALRELSKSEKRLIRARIFRVWVESNPKINLFTYPYYRWMDRKIIKTIEGVYGEIK